MKNSNGTAVLHTFHRSLEPYQAPVAEIFSCLVASPVLSISDWEEGEYYD